MKKTEIYEYYAFGYNYGLIKNDGLKNYKKENAVEILQGFFDSVDELDLQVTKIMIRELSEIYEELKITSVEVIKDEISSRIKKATEKFDPGLDAELQLKSAYVLTKKRYSLDTLLDHPDDLLGNGVFLRLSDTSKRDFGFACIQIALSQPTAAAFHLMRALEEQVKTLYFAFKKTKRLEKPMWGSMTNELKSKKAPKPSEKLLNHLDGMRVHFRNPTQHPELFYSLDESQDLLNQTITAINMIDAEIPR